MAKAHPLKTWFRQHTSAQRAELAKRAKTSLPYLRHVIAGRRALSPELAIRLEAASVRIGRPLPQGDLCKVCGGCPYYLTH